MAPHKELSPTVEKRPPSLHNGPGAGTVKRDCSCILVALKELATFVVKHQSGRVIVRSEREHSLTASDACKDASDSTGTTVKRDGIAHGHLTDWDGTGIDPALDVAMLMIAQRANRFQQKLPQPLSVSAMNPMKSS